MLPLPPFPTPSDTRVASPRWTFQSVVGVTRQTKGKNEAVAANAGRTREGTGDMERAQEDVKVLGGEQAAVTLTAAGLGMIGLLLGLVAFFITVAPGS